MFDEKPLPIDPKKVEGLSGTSDESLVKISEEFKRIAGLPDQGFKLPKNFKMDPNWFANYRVLQANEAEKNRQKLKRWLRSKGFEKSA